MAARRVVFTPLAEQQIESLYHYVAEAGGRERADRHVGDILAYCQSLGEFPERGTRRDDLSPGLRVTGYRRRVSIALTVEADRVVIHGVFHGGRRVALPQAT